MKEMPFGRSNVPAILCGADSGQVTPKRLHRADCLGSELPARPLPLLTATIDSNLAGGLAMAAGRLAFKILASTNSYSDAVGHDTCGC